MTLNNEILAEYFKYCESYFYSEDLNEKKKALQAIGELNVKRGKLASDPGILIFYVSCNPEITKFKKAQYKL